VSSHILLQWQEDVEADKEVTGSTVSQFNSFNDRLFGSGGCIKSTQIKANESKKIPAISEY